MSFLEWFVLGMPCWKRLLNLPIVEIWYKMIIPINSRGVARWCGFGVGDSLPGALSLIQSKGFRADNRGEGSLLKGYFLYV
jgi:hypothetical protein